MPKAVLEFNLPEERDEYELVNNAGTLLVALNDVMNIMRREYKYNDQLTEDQHQFLEKLREECWTAIRDAGVPDSLI